MVDAGQTFFQGNPFDIIGDPGKNRPGFDPRVFALTSSNAQSHELEDTVSERGI